MLFDARTLPQKGHTRQRGAERPRWRLLSFDQSGRLAWLSERGATRRSRDAAGRCCPFERWRFRWERKVDAAEPYDVAGARARRWGWRRSGRRIGEMWEAVCAHALRDGKHPELLAFGGRSLTNAALARQASQLAACLLGGHERGRLGVETVGDDQTAPGAWVREVRDPMGTHAPRQLQQRIIVRPAGAQLPG